MMSEAVNVLGEPGRMKLLYRRHDSSVEHAPSVLQEARVRDLMAQGVLECAFHLRDEPRLVQELAFLQPHQTGVERFLRQVRHCLEQGERHVLADDGCHL